MVSYSGGRAIFLSRFLLKLNQRQMIFVLLESEQKNRIALVDQATRLSLTV
jgi:hypothetical protein